MRSSKAISDVIVMMFNFGGKPYRAMQAAGSIVETVGLVTNQVAQCRLDHLPSGSGPL